MTTGCLHATAPSLGDFEVLSAEAFERLPAQFRAHCGTIAIHVADFADDETLAEMQIESPFELTGLYRGTDLTRRSHEDVLTMPDEVWLYRRPILDEWADRGDVRLDALITHVLVHEIGHHFGLDDDDIEAMEVVPDSPAAGR